MIIGACSMDDETIEKKIIQKQEQIAKIEQQIADLRKKMSDTTETDTHIPVNIKKLQGEPFNHYIVVYGNVEARNYAAVSPEMSGRVRTIHVKEGSKVREGQLLVSLNTDAVKNNIKNVKSSLELAVSTFNKTKALWDDGVGSEIQYLQAKSNMESLEAQLQSLEAQMNMSLIKAPFNGYVDKIFLKEGEYASQMVPMVEMVALDKLKITADVSETYTGRINTGDVVQVSFDALPAISINTPVINVSKMINRDSRTFQIEFEIDNREEKIRPNMVSTIMINDYSADKAMVVPSLIIKKDISGDYVYIVNRQEGKSTVQKNYVKPSMTYEDQTLITKGLQQGDEVIVDGYNLVSSGVEVRVKESEQ